MRVEEVPVAVFVVSVVVLVKDVAVLVKDVWVKVDVVVTVTVVADVVVGARQTTVLLPLHMDVSRGLQPVYSLQRRQPGRSAGHACSGSL